MIMDICNEDAETLPSIDLPSIYGDDRSVRSLPSLPDSLSDQDIDDMDIDAATALVSDSQATVSQIIPPTRDPRGTHMGPRRPSQSYDPIWDPRGASRIRGG